MLMRLLTKCRPRRRLLGQVSLTLIASLAMLWLLHRGRDGGANRWIHGRHLLRFWAARPTPTSTPMPPPSEVTLLALIRNGSVRCGAIQGMYPRRIPPVVHWTNKDDRIILRHQSLLRSWTRVFGASVAYMYWNDESAGHLIKRHYPLVWRQYQRLSAGIMRSDIARLVILHHVGGVYADLDVELRLSLHPLMVSHSALWSQEPIEHVYYMYKRTRMLSNAIYLTKAKHPFLDFVLANWPSWFESTWSKKQLLLNNPSQAIFITGPVMLNHFLELYANATDKEPLPLADPDTFQPTWDSWYARMVSKRQCTLSQASMTPEQRRHCERLRARGFEPLPVGNKSFAEHKFLHTSYGRPNDYAKSVLARDILPLSHCVI